MKILCLIILLLAATFFCSSCQKKFSFEARNAKGLLEKTDETAFDVFIMQKKCPVF